MVMKLPSEVGDIFWSGADSILTPVWWSVVYVGVGPPFSEESTSHNPPHWGPGLLLDFSYDVLKQIMIIHVV